MRRLNLFLTILIASLIALITLVAIGFAIFTSPQTSQYPSGWMGQMWGEMGGMMGGQSGAPQTSANPLLPYFGVLFIVLIIVTVVGIGGLAYYIAFPQIKRGITEPAFQKTENPLSPLNMPRATPYDSVVKTLTDEERKVIDVLNSHDGKYLQKYIRKETGLSRLKTHRIVARLAERGIVSFEKTGNTNQVFLADWLQQQKQSIN